MTSQENKTCEAAEVEQKVAKAIYESPKLIVHGKVEKLTLATGDGIPGGGGTGGGGSTVIP